MSTKDPTQLRIEVARGHWSLGEHAEAVACLERAVGKVSDHNPLMVLVGTLLDDVAAGPVVDRLIAVRDRLLGCMEDEADFEVPAEASPPEGPILDAEPLTDLGAIPASAATPTMAQLLADQGHADSARAVAEDALRRNPTDARALAVRNSLNPDPRARTIARLERWRGVAQRRSKTARQRAEGENQL